MKTFIFTEAFNAGKILSIALSSFHKHHDRKAYVFGTADDFERIADKNHPNTIFIDMQEQGLLNKFTHGHLGTAEVFATALTQFAQEHTHAIHFDSDIYFKQESISLIENAFEEGYDIVGSRRTYGNNPAEIPNLGHLPDTTSTYFFGIRLGAIPKRPFDYFCKMCQGTAHPPDYRNYSGLDFFDPVTHDALRAGARIKHLDWNLIGGQNSAGKKNNDYASNMHMDVGSHLIHFGGVGSGYAYKHGKSNPAQSYAKWAAGRWSLFAKVFYNEDIGYHEPTQYKGGRWVYGNYDAEILANIRMEMT